MAPAELRHRGQEQELMDQLQGGESGDGVSG